MAMDLARFTQLCNTLAKIDLFGSDPKVRPNVSSSAAIKTAIANGGPNMPLSYRQTYVAAVSTHLSDVLVQIKTMSAAQRAGIIERFYGPVYEHAVLTSMRDVRPELRRFLAVISNLYR